MLGEVRPGPEGGDPGVWLGGVEETDWTGGVARPETSQRQPEQPGDLQGLHRTVISTDITEVIQQVQTGLWTVWIFAGFLLNVSPLNLNFPDMKMRTVVATPGEFY